MDGAGKDDTCGVNVERGGKRIRVGRGDRAGGGGQGPFGVGGTGQPQLYLSFSQLQNSANQSFVPSGPACCHSFLLSFF